MTKKLTTPLVLVLLMLLTTCLVISCKKENNSTGNVELLSFGPTGAKHGDTLRFFGNRLDQVTAISFTGEGAMVEKSAFIRQSNDQILLIVPASAVEGFVTMQTSNGEIVSKTRFNLNVTSQVTGMPATARPGQNITLTGDFLNWVTSVVFSNDKAVTNFVSQSMNELVLTVPEDAQTGPLQLFYSGTESSDVRTDDTLNITLPQAVSFTPNPVRHQTNITITGTDLDLARQILFTGVAAPVTSFVSQTATQIVVTVPASATQGKISLVAASGVVTQPDAELVLSLPDIADLSPNPVDPGADLTITGTNLDLVTRISFTGAPSAITSFVSQTATQLVVTVPAGTLKGKLTFGVLNSTLTVESSQVLDLNGGLPPLADFPFPIYTDALQNTFQDYSYTDIHDFNSTAVVRQGDKSIRAVYGGNTYQGVTFHAGTPQSTAGYTTFEFSVFGDASMAGKKLQLITNSNYGGPAPQVTITGGEWNTFSIPLSSMGSFTSLSEVVLQAAGFTGTIHIDHVGLR